VKLKSNLKMSGAAGNMVHLRGLVKHANGELGAEVSPLTCKHVRDDVTVISVEELVEAKVVKRAADLKTYRKTLPSQVTVSVC
jgi:hypothetical protein